jgi:tellurite resistance protein TerC
MFGTSSASADVSPLGEDADRLARATLSRIRKIAIFVIGMTGLIVGFVMAIGPGPGIPILIIALALLASEFVWARVLVNKYRKKAEDAANFAAAEARKRFRPWAMAGLMSITLLVGLLIHLYGHIAINFVWGLLSSNKELLEHRIPIGLVIGGIIPVLFGQVFLAYLAYVRKPPTPNPPTQAPPST